MRCVRCAAPGRQNRVLDQRVGLGVAGQPLAHQGQAAEHRHQDVVEVVRDTASELTDGLHFLRVKQQLSGSLEGHLRVAFLGDIACHLGEAQQLAVGVANGVDHHVRPELAAVFAYPPALALEPAFTPGGLDGSGGFSASAIVVGVEAREVGADDLAGQVPLDALGAQVPVVHVPCRVEHVDGVIGDALDQHIEELFALVKRLLGDVALGEVASDLRVPDHRASR